ncbi:hypothetical protein [Dinghuibacter silviterrae]|uniref:Uncharacterized protein n=1 Tax=Dinghuibacter silviterrae TaxID=1539049 RepID=A0A4V3GKT2_9BACT|nr:hypothetical protein [Dinghuibacter silviterrae]TDW96842.1 hypothetical protein EDB95_4678 [Dinghuibacter silviterrae]
MKGETETFFQSAKPLTRKILDQLKAAGVQYVTVKGYTLDKRPDYIEPYYILLVPVKKDSGSLGIYEPIDSQILSGWADGGTETKILVAGGGWE